jgi:hypothetical protein
MRFAFIQAGRYPHQPRRAREGRPVDAGYRQCTFRDSNSLWSLVVPTLPL